MAPIAMIHAAATQRCAGRRSRKAHRCRAGNPTVMHGHAMLLGQRAAKILRQPESAAEHADVCRHRGRERRQPAEPWNSDRVTQRDDEIMNRRCGRAPRCRARPSFDFRPPSTATMPSSRLHSSRSCTPAAPASRFQGFGSSNSAAAPAAAKTSDRIDMPSAVNPAHTAVLARNPAQRVERLASGRRASGLLMSCCGHQLVLSDGKHC